ncbi:hypothetical protein AXE65_09705 [Ventosimonas gracilis]|uniref:BrnT family toxin n=1 Tax=Ventosimonas gracilis TaxID=1680762 RepID=A0A139SXW6_9GAMM|nr:BrnT family toxin [Ventosimonas gracilis]KXU39222.1 hypothetical protein AXE65_09705 [Ventosimonas gracilis]
MMIEFDPAKDAMNRDKHGISLFDATRFEWDTAHIKQDGRFDYGEQRFQAIGYIGERLHFMVFCVRAGKKRIISLRKANKREFNDYVRDLEKR